MFGHTTTDFESFKGEREKEKRETDRPNEAQDSKKENMVYESKVLML